MVYLCNSIAAASPQVTVDVVDADTFPDLVARHRVGKVPLVLVNGTVAITDPVPAAELIARIAGG